jgi:hypothetical protein
MHTRIQISLLFYNMLSSKLSWMNVTLTILTLILLTWRIWWAPNNASKWQMGLNSAFKGLKLLQSNLMCECECVCEWVWVCWLQNYLTNRKSEFYRQRILQFITLWHPSLLRTGMEIVTLSLKLTITSHAYFKTLVNIRDSCESNLTHSL